MSRLRVGIAGRIYAMNVLAFQSGIYQTIASAQTKTRVVHFPVKVNQPDIDFDVIFSSERRFEEFQRAVRYHQQAALVSTRLLTLNWPERGIDNWTGVVKSFQGGGARRNYTPRVQFTVQLVDSLASRRTEAASVAMPWQTIYGGIGMGVDAVLQFPSQALNNYLNEQYGGNALAAGVGTVPPGFD